jgi:ATP-dependent helicase/DNAse subunit B
MDAWLFCSPHWQALEDAAFKAWQESDGGALILVPSTMLRNWWLSQLAENLGGAHGEAVVTLERFAERLAQKASQTLARLARPIELRLAAWDAFHACDVPNQWRVSGIVDAFLDAVEELELHGLKPEEVAAMFPDDNNIQHLTKLWQHWRKVLNEQNLWTVGDVLQKGTKAAEHLRSELPSEIIAYGFTALTDLRWQFFRALQNCGVNSVKFFVPISTENEPAYRYAQDFVNLLKSHGIKVCPIQVDGLPDELDAIVRNAFRWQKENETTKQTDRIVCVAAAGEEQEVETAISVLTRWRREEKLQHYSDVLLLVRSLDKYLPALEAVSARYGIDFALLSEGGQPAHGLQRLLSALAEVRQQGLDGERLWQILPSPYLQVDGKPLLPLELERHKETLTRIRQNIIETDAEVWAQRLTDDERERQKLREFFQAVSQLPTKAPAHQHAQAWRNLLDKFIAPSDGDERERSALRRVRETLNSLMAWSTELSLDEVVGLLMDACRLPERTFGDAVKVATVAEARGLWSPVVVLLGLNDDEFPQTPSQFELLTDEHRKKLQSQLKLLTPLKLRSRFTLAERMLFMEAVGAATERLVLAYRRTDAEGKLQAASVFLSAVENALEASGWRWELEERDLGDVVPRDLPEAVDSRDAEKFATFVAFTGVEPSDEVKAWAAKALQDEEFRNRLRTEWWRWDKPQQGCWDGKIPSLSSQIVSQLQTSGLRVTALEDYGDCPYKFFARHILNLRRPQDITYTVDHRTIGSLWHEIMAKFLQEWQQKGALPDKQRLQEIADCVVAQQLANFPSMVRELMRNQVLAAVEKVWQAEANEKAQGWRPIGAEVTQQIEAGKLGDVPYALKHITINLKIDRIDENAKGQLRVADYKTGSAPAFKEIENGVALQLPFYALALGDKVVAAMFLRLLKFTSKGYSVGCQLVTDVRNKRNQRQLSEMQQKAVAWVQQFLKGIADADFTVLPFSTDDSCRCCEFKALCRQSKLRLNERRHQLSVRESSD